MTEGRLYVISGPSAVGKGTIVTTMIKGSDTIDLSISATTRGPRDGETDGVHYYFVSKEKFEEGIRNGEFLEYAEVHANYYGTPLAPVKEKLALGRDVILEIDVQGAMNVKKVYAEAVTIFILPPTMKDLRDRLAGRGTESPEQVALRLGKAMTEMEYLSGYDYYVVNDDLEKAIEEVSEIMKAERHNDTDGVEYLKVKGRADSILEKYKEENA